MSIICQFTPTTSHNTHQTYATLSDTCLHFPSSTAGYHFFNEQGTHDDILKGVLTTYEGPLTLATDNMVWNITKGNIVVRDIVSPDQAWSVNGPNKPPSPPAPGSQPDPMTDFIKQGRWAPAEKAQAPMVNQFKKENNLK
jgi:ribonuclease Z